MNRYVAICDKEIQHVKQVQWEPWINCDPERDDHEFLACMAVHKMIRTRGGVQPDEEPFFWFVYVRDTMELPAVVYYFKFKISPK